MKLNPLSAACALAAGRAVRRRRRRPGADLGRRRSSIGFITDMSGLYADIDGPGGVEAIKMAIADAGGAINGKKIELVFADHQNKADIAAAKAREWFDTARRRHADRRHQLRHQPGDGQGRGREEEARSSRSAPARSALTNEQCTPYTIHYAYDTVALAKGTGGAVVKAGGKSWYFLTADYAFGTALQDDTADGRQGRRRQGARLGQAPAVGQRLLVVPAAGAGAARRRSSAWPTPAATPSTRSRRPTSSASPRR